MDVERFAQSLSERTGESVSHCRGYVYNFAYAWQGRVGGTVYLAIRALLDENVENIIFDFIQEKRYSADDMAWELRIRFNPLAAEVANRDS